MTSRCSVLLLLYPRQRCWRAAHAGNELSKHAGESAGMARHVWLTRACYYSCFTCIACGQARRLWSRNAHSWRLMPTKNYKQPRLCDSWYTILQRLSCYISYSEKGWNLRRCPKPDNPKIPPPLPYAVLYWKCHGRRGSNAADRPIHPSKLADTIVPLEGHGQPEAVVMFSIWCKHWLWF